MTRRTPAVATLGLLLLLSGCASSRAHTATSTRAGKVKPRVQEGIASWYGPGFHGRRTASGEIYDMNGVSAAHRTLPLGTLIEVRNLDNGRTLVAPVNDRGPWVRGRIVDLSLGAARELGIEHSGLARVRVTVVGGSLATAPSYWVQVGAFRDEERARSLATELERRYPGTAVLPAAEWWRVRVPSGERRRDAETLRKRLRRAGYQAFLVLASEQG